MFFSRTGNHPLPALNFLIFCLKKWLSSLACQELPSWNSSSQKPHVILVLDVKETRTQEKRGSSVCMSVPWLYGPFLCLP